MNTMCSAGDCGPTQVCNAPITDDLEYERQLTTFVGTCVTPVAAGSKCVVGYGKLSGVTLARCVTAM